MIGSGERIVIVAHQEPQTRGELNVVSSRAEKSGGGYVLDGHKNVIAHGGAADELLITARTSGKPDDTSGMSLFRLDPKTSGVTIKAYSTIDGQHAADVALARVKVPAANLIGQEGKAYDAIEAAHQIGISAICAEAVGIMKAVNAATLEYSKSRKQFGQPIGKFQVLQHRMADMFIQSEQATSMSYLAAIKCRRSGSERTAAFPVSRQGRGRPGGSVRRPAGSTDPRRYGNDG